MDAGQSDCRGIVGLLIIEALARDCRCESIRPIVGSIVPARSRFNGNITAHYRKLQRLDEIIKPLPPPSLSLSLSLSLSDVYANFKLKLLPSTRAIVTRRARIEHRDNNDGDNDDSACVPE